MTNQTTDTRPNYTRSEIFSVYNKARQSARFGKLDEARTNRALGLLISGEYARRPYRTSISGCSCPDRRRRFTCKHMIAAMIAVRIDEARDAAQAEEIAEVAALMECNFYAMADYEAASHGI